MTVARPSDRQSQEEQLDWLSSMHEELRAQTDLLEQQAQTLVRFERYLRGVYGAAAIWVVLVVLGVFGWLMVFATSR